MTTFLNYLVEANSCLLIFALAYWALLKNENQFSFKRAYLVSTILLSVILPLLNFDLGSLKNPIPSVSNFTSTVWLEPVIIGGVEEVSTSSPGIGLLKIVETLYVMLVVLFCALFLIRLFNITKLWVESRKYDWQNCVVAESVEEKPTFSFFHFIFIGQANLLTTKEKEEILFHESVHVAKKHSLDIILINLVGIVFWFNPIIRFYKKEFTQLHEFEADNKSVENKDLDQYCGLLAKVALQKINYPLGNHFNQSLTLKRIAMMKTMKQQIKMWKIAASLIVTIVLFIAVACQERVAKNEALIDQQLKNLPADVIAKLNRLKLESPKSNFQVFELSTSEVDEYIEANPKAYINSLGVVAKADGSSKSYLFVEPNGIFEQIPKNESEIFVKVDEVATPIFGKEQFYKNVQYSIQYPEEAKKKGIEGKVFVEFIIETDGKVSNVKVIKSVEESIDTEAMRAIYQLSGNWNPAIHQGQIVKQRMVMPIVFSLKKQASEERLNEKNKIGEEEMKVVFSKSTADHKTTIKGKVVYSKDNGPLPGVTIILKNSTNTVNTDSEGKFEYESLQANGTLLFSFVGFKRQELAF